MDGPKSPQGPAAETLRWEEMVGGLGDGVLEREWNGSKRWAEPSGLWASW